jgi:DNA polymerase-3 subunit delta'
MDWEVLGHEWAAKLLQQHILRGNVRHAYLFTGAPGVGRRTLALRFAQALNCPQPPAPGEACRKCRTCEQIEAMQYADLAVVQAETVGGTLKVEQIRNLQHSLSLAPYQGKYRLALLLRFEEAHISAQSAFLKTLEEAPEKVILLLTADSAENLLPTIASRCENLRLRPLPVEQLQRVLVAQHGMKDDDARLLAHLSGGRVGAALYLRQDKFADKKRREWLDELLRLIPATRRARFSFVEKAAKDKEALRLMLQVWLTFWRDLLLCASGSNTPLTNVDYAAQIQTLAGKVGLAAARARTAELERGIEQLDANLNPRLLVEVLLLAVSV